MASGFEKGRTPKTVVSVWSVAHAQHSCAFEIQRKNVWSELVVSRGKNVSKAMTDTERYMVEHLKIATVAHNMHDGEKEEKKTIKF